MEQDTERLESEPIYTEPPEENIHNNQYMPIPENNQYAPLAENDEDEEDYKKSTGVEDESTGVDINNDKSTGVKSESTRVTEENYKSDNMALIKESISEAERDIAEGTELLAGNADKGETEEDNFGGREDKWD